MPAVHVEHACYLPTLVQLVSLSRPMLLPVLVHMAEICGMSCASLLPSHPGHLT